MQLRLRQGTTFLFILLRCLCASMLAAFQPIAAVFIRLSKKWATARLRGGTVLAAAEAGAATGESALTARVESFTVRLPVRLRCGSEPYLIIHSAARPYRYIGACTNAHRLTRTDARSSVRANIAAGWRRF